MARRRLVLDANILIRAVLGSRVRGVITAYAAGVEFFAPSIAYDEAERHLPEILTKHDRAGQVEAALAYLTQLRKTVVPVPEEAYREQRPEALARIEQRDPDDWPILASAMVLDCPIWTEDNDFFGSGVPTWTTDRVELYLKPSH